MSWPASGGLLLGLAVSGGEAREVIAQALEAAGECVDVVVATSRRGRARRRATIRRCDSRSTRRPAVGGRDQLGAPVAVVLAALDVARSEASDAIWRLATDRSTPSRWATSLTRSGAVQLDRRERREPLGAELGERVALDVAADHAEPVELADEGFDGCELIGH